MNKNLPKYLINIWKFTRSNIRYFLVLLVFLFVLAVGKNLNPRPVDESLVSRVDSLTKLERGVYEISAAGQSLKIENLSQLSRGDGFRVLMDIESNNGNYPQLDLTRNNDLEMYKLKISLQSSTGRKKLIQILDLKNNSVVKNVEILGVADDRYSILVLDRDNIESKIAITVQNLKLNRINTVGGALPQLKSTVSGQTDESKIIQSNSLGNIGKGYQFNDKNQSIGQVFTAESDSISGVDFKINTIGSGGLGNYFLELREVAESPTGIKVGANRLAYYYFKMDDLEKLQYGQNSYHFPIGAKLIKGIKYFIGLNNESVSTNYFNNLRLLDCQSDSFNGFGLSVKNGESARLNNFYFNLFGVTYSKISGEPILTGATVEDLGQGEGSYHYRSNQSATDFLDIFSVNSTTNPTIVYYDNVQQGITGLSQNNTEFTYKFNTVYPFKQMSINLSRYQGEVRKPQVSYSYDNQNWKNLIFSPSGPEVGSDTQLDQTILGDGRQSQIYLKITYDPTGFKSTSNLFGVSDVEANADLIIK